MTPEQIKTKLEGLQKEANSALTEKARKEGQIVEIDKNLAENYGLHSISDVDAELAKLDSEISVLESKINSDYETLIKDFRL